MQSIGISGVKKLVKHMLTLLVPIPEEELIFYISIFNIFISEMHGTLMVKNIANNFLTGVCLFWGH